MQASAGTHKTEDQTGGMVTGESSQAPVSTQPPSPSSDMSSHLSTQVSSVEYIAGQIKSHKKVLAIGAALVILALMAVVFAAYRFISRRSETTAPFASMKIEKLTDTGKAGSVAISPDGKMVVHILQDAGQQSLWIRHIATGSNVQVIPPAEVYYGGMTFSSDGSYVYFVRAGKNDFTGSLYSMPVFGGDVKKLVDSVESPITFSPDGKTFAFIRRHPIKSETYLVLTDADGSNQRNLATLADDQQFDNSGPAWSPDGKKIVVGIAKTTGGYHEYMATVGTEDGTVKPLGSQEWDLIGRLGWLGDGASLVATLVEKGAKGAQYYMVSYPDGTARKITNDVNDYHDLSLTANSAILATVQEDRVQNIWIAPGSDEKSLRQLTFGSGKYEGATGVKWTPDGRIVYSAFGGGVGDIWIMGPDGSGQKRLTNTPLSYFSGEPDVSPDGRSIVFISDRSGKTHLWLMDIDGGNARQLTSGDLYEQLPSFSPDGRWVFYASYDGEHLGLAKIPVEGGEPIQLTQGFLADTPRLSWDGKILAAYYRESGGAPLKLVLLPVDGGKPTEFFDTPQNPCIYEWARDSRSLAYCDSQKGVTNIWEQPIDGGKPHQVTNFTSQEIISFNLDRAGKPTLFSRGEVHKDVVLITGFR